MAVALTAAIASVSTIFYFKAIQSSDLSLTVPMLTFTPLFLLFTSPFMLGESPRPLGLLGIVFIVLGSYVLNFKDRGDGYAAPFKKLVSEKGARYMLMVAFLYSIGANVDKIGVANSSPLLWCVVLNSIMAVLLFPVMLTKTPGAGRQLKTVWPFLLAMGLCGAVALIAQMIAIRLTIVPYLIAVKRTSVFMTALFGFWLFKEKNIRERILGALFMLVGVFAIAFFR